MQNVVGRAGGVMLAEHYLLIKNIHIGPALEFAYEPEDFHISLGIHLGYGF